VTWRRNRSPRIPLPAPHATLAPGAVFEVAELAQEMALDHTGLKEVFSAVATEVERDLLLPVPPDAAWRVLQTELCALGRPESTMAR